MHLTDTEKKTVRLALTGLAYREIASITETTTQMVLMHPEWVDGERCGECGRMR
jgi:DNA-binding CsgD family transcriptional regulator